MTMMLISASMLALCRLLRLAHRLPQRVQCPLQAHRCLQGGPRIIRMAPLRVKVLVAAVVIKWEALKVPGLLLKGDFGKEGYQVKELKARGLLFGVEVPGCPRRGPWARVLLLRMRGSSGKPG